MIRESQSGGVLTYPFRNESDVLASSGRQSALRLIDQKCPQGSRIVHEGEVPKIRKDVDRIWEGQMSGSRLWGVEFTCK